MLTYKYYNGGYNINMLTQYAYLGLLEDKRKRNFQITDSI